MAKPPRSVLAVPDRTRSGIFKDLGVLTWRQPIDDLPGNLSAVPRTVGRRAALGWASGRCASGFAGGAAGPGLVGRAPPPATRWSAGGASGGASGGGGGGRAGRGRAGRGGGGGGGLVRPAVGVRPWPAGLVLALAQLHTGAQAPADPLATLARLPALALGLAGAGPGTPGLADVLELLGLQARPLPLGSRQGAGGLGRDVQ